MRLLQVGVKALLLVYVLFLVMMLEEVLVALSSLSKPTVGCLGGAVSYSEVPL